MNRIARTEAFLKAKLAENPDASIHPERMAYRLEHSVRVANIGREIARAEGLAEEAIVIVKQILSGGVPESSHLFKRKEVSEYLGISMDSLRNWEMNGLLTVKRKQNGYRVYTDEDIQRLIIIRSLRCANYSLEAILHMLRQLSENPDTDIAIILNTPKQDSDIISVCDRLIVSLSAAEKNAYKILSMLQDMKVRFL